MSFFFVFFFWLFFFWYYFLRAVNQRYPDVILYAQLRIDMIINQAPPLEWFMVAF